MSKKSKTYTEQEVLNNVYDEENGSLFMSGVGRYRTYESKSFTITGAQTNYNVATQQTMFATDKKTVSVKCDFACTIKINATTNDSISLEAGEQITIDGFAVSNIFVTTTASTTIRILSFA